MYERDLPYVYGVQPPSRSYGTAALRYAVLSGGVRHLALLYRSDDPYSAAVCEGIRTAAAGIVRELVPGLKLYVRQYNAANVTAASATDGAVFYRGLARGAMAAGVDGVAACDTYAESGVLAGAFVEVGAARGRARVCGVVVAVNGKEAPHAWTRTTTFFVRFHARLGLPHPPTRPGPRAPLLRLFM